MGTQAEEAIAAADYAFGRQEGNHRTFHAKGIVCRGTFAATAEAAGLTRAAHMQGAEIPVTVRFSNGAGNPHSNDALPDGRGMATKFYLPDGGKTDIVALTLPCFFVRTPEDFVAFTRAGKPFLFGKPGPALALYLARHREALPAVKAALGWKPPVSYATALYNALHAYKWISADGSERFVRYTWLPAAGEESLSVGAAKKLGPDYLQTEIAERMAGEPVRFTLQVQIAGPDDPTDDPTRAWPDDRERVDVGRLELTGLDTEREKGDDILVFDPTRVTDGIELSDDPIPKLRSEAYSISIERRSGAKRPAELA
jgi:catalase